MLPSRGPGQAGGQVFVEGLGHERWALDGWLVPATGQQTGPESALWAGKGGSSGQPTEQGVSWPTGRFSLLQCNSLLPFPNLPGKVSFWS